MLKILKTGSYDDNFYSLDFLLYLLLIYNLILWIMYLILWVFNMFKFAKALCTFILGMYNIAMYITLSSLKNPEIFVHW